MHTEGAVASQTAPYSRMIILAACFLVKQKYDAGRIGTIELAC
jgi:hypothetical protein